MLRYCVFARQSSGMCVCLALDACECVYDYTITTAADLAESPIELIEHRANCIKQTAEHKWIW